MSRSRSTVAAVLFVSCFVPSRVHAEGASDVAVADARRRRRRISPARTSLGIAPAFRGRAHRRDPGGRSWRTPRRRPDRVCDGAGPCSIERGARFGWNLAAGLGAWFRARDRGRVRLDARVQYYALDLYGLDATLLGSKIQVHETLSGARVLLTAGAEVF